MSRNPRSSRCIWCLKPPTGNHVEHIIPEAVGCPDGFVLRSDQICLKCNNDLAHLDQAVCDEFDIQSWLAGVPRKKGRKAIIASRGNVRGTRGNNGLEITFNLENYPVVAHDGSTLAAYKGGARDIKPTFSLGQGIAKTSFEVPFGQSPKFVRGL